MAKITVVVVDRKKAESDIERNEQLAGYVKEKVLRERIKNGEKDFSLRENKQG